jgi:ArsR family transcriptional regulator, arsenate/arsenite/antimonite-responsive transcriptional repressor
MPRTTVKELARTARALGDATRLRLLRLVARGEISCQDLTDRVGLAQATVSHHLKVLSEAGLVSARKEGPFHWYRASPGALAAHAAAVARLVPGPFVKPVRLRGIDGGRR